MKNASKNKKNIALIGHGTMGKILLEVLYNMNTFSKLYVIDKNFENIGGLKRKFKNNVIFSTNIDDSLECDVVFFAVKPQDFRNTPLSVKSDTLVISIMAGISVGELAKVLSATKIIRAMPNTPAKIKKGVIGWFANKNVSSKEKEFAQEFFSGMGSSLGVSSEKEIDMITAVSGSGPAYVFYMLDCLIQAARSIGLSHDTAKNIALETFKGSIALIDQDTDLSLLIKNVASKGGTTEAALKEFNASKTVQIWKKAVTKAYKRSKELSTLK